MPIEDLPIFDDDEYNKIKQDLELVEVAEISAKGFSTSEMCVGGLYKNDEGTYLILVPAELPIGVDRNGKYYLGYTRLFIKKETVVEYKPLKRVDKL